MTSFVEVADDAEVRIVRITRAKANALVPAVVEQLIEAIEAVRSDGRVQAMVLGSAQPRFFSAGFDVREVFAYRFDEMRRFFARFIDLYQTLLWLPKPAIAALSGHTFAGGAFLALASDARTMTRGDCAFALNEIDLSVLLPPAIRRMLIAAVGAREASQIILGGRRVTPLEALRIGLVDDVVSETEVLPAAVALARRLAAKPADAFALTKLALHRDAGHRDGPGDQAFLDEFLAQWFSPGCVERRRALAASLER